MSELRLLLFAVAAISLVAIPFEVVAGIPLEDAVVRCFQWLFLTGLFILARRKLAARKLPETPRYRVSNAAILWFMLFLILSIGMYYWQHPVSFTVPTGDTPKQAAVPNDFH